MSSENVFDALSSHASKSKSSQKNETTNEPNLLSTATVESGTSNDESSWTVQSSTKRRLAPQYALSKSDIGVDSPKNRASATQQEVVKKKGSL